MCCTSTWTIWLLPGTNEDSYVPEIWAEKCGTLKWVFCQGWVSEIQLLGDAACSGICTWAALGCCVQVLSCPVLSMPPTHLVCLLCSTLRSISLCLLFPMPPEFIFKPPEKNKQTWPQCKEMVAHESRQAHAKVFSVLLKWGWQVTQSHFAGWLCSSDSQQ